MPSEYQLLFTSTVIEIFVLLFVGFEVLAGELRHHRATAMNEATLYRLGIRRGLLIILVSAAVWAAIVITYLIMVRPEASNLATAEAQKATLIDWLQTAQHERDDARQERDHLKKTLQSGQPAMQTYGLTAPKKTPDPKVCADLLQQLANAPQAEAKNQQQHVWRESSDPLEEQIRSVMKRVGCLPD